LNKFISNKTNINCEQIQTNFLKGFNASIKARDKAKLKYQFFVGDIIIIFLEVKMILYFSKEELKIISSNAANALKMDIRQDSMEDYMGCIRLYMTEVPDWRPDYFNNEWNEERNKMAIDTDDTGAKLIRKLLHYQTNESTDLF
jgi:hypothetical protein